MDHESAVLELVDLIPSGRATTYGRIAAALGSGGPRQVAAVLARSGGAVTWWRVVRADGTLPPALTDRARPHWLAEGTPRTERGLDLSQALWDPCLDLSPAELSAALDGMAP